MNRREEQIVKMIKNRIYGKNPDADVILFGSHARGDAREDSDWDILILLNRMQVDREIEKEYREELFEIELEFGEAISTFVFSKEEWETKYSITPLYKNIKRDGVRLV